MQDETLASFVENFEAVAGVAHVVASAEAAGEKVLELIRAAGAARVAVAQAPEAVLRAMRSASDAGAFSLKAEPHAAETLPMGLNDVQIGITGIDFGIAQSGTLVEVAANDATRLVSSMPRTYIGILRAADIVPTLFDASARLREVFQRHGGGVTVSFISGPSRTGDIEMILTLGVHGPERAHAIIIQE